MTTTEHSYTASPALMDTLKRYSNMAAFIGLIFLVLTAAGVVLPGGGAAQVMRSYLVGFWIWFGAGAGCLVILMTQYLTGGAWGLVIRRPLEAGAKTLYVMAFFLLPLVLFHEKLYWWTTPEGLADKVIHAKRLYLNLPFFYVRTVIYAVFLVGITYLLTKWSKLEDETKSIEYSKKLENFSAPGVVIFFLLMTFASIDYLMTLEPYWYSTVYGFMVVMGMCLTAMSVAIAVLAMLSRFSPMDHAITSKHLHDLGKLLLSLVMLWAYMNFSQLLITWSGNLPTEIMWYIKRWNGGWGWVALILLIGHFILPFVLLLSQDLKKNPRTIAAIAIFLIVVHAVDVFSLIEPNFQSTANPHFTMSWLDVAAPLGFGGLWLALFFRNLQSMPLLPLGAPDLIKGLNHGRHH
ncbi:MAG: hypothetical protein ABJC09_05385 [Terriglobia bacterium]